MPLLMFLLVVWVLKNAAMDVTYAANGKPNPRYATQPGARSRTQPRYLTREYFADFWSDALTDSTEERRRRRVAKRDRDERRRINAEALGRRRAVPPIDVDARPAPPQPQSAPTPAPGPKPEPVSRPAPGSTPEPAAEADTQSAVVIKFPHIVKEEPPVSVDTAEVVGLDQSIEYARQLAAHAATHGSAGNESYIGTLVSRKVKGAALQSAHDMQEAFDNAHAVADRHRRLLEQQKAVQEQYDLNGDAGDKDYMQEGR